jgi:arylsulfatase
MSIPWRYLVAVLIGLSVASVAAAGAEGRNRGASAAGLDRTVLPIAEPRHEPITEIDFRKVTAPPPFAVEAPPGAPNVVIILLDDIGFGQTMPFGGPIPMPTLDRLAQSGLKYNCFHTTALCSPTRMALLTGRNHHSAGAGTVMEISNCYPGSTGRRPNNVAPLAEILRLNGYSTAAFGKSHETPAWERSASGPFDRWPTHSGFDKFYGFMGGDTDQWSPALYDGTTRIQPPKDPNYHFTVDITNQAIAWMRLQKAMTPQRPFFLYFAPGALHAPHHAPKEWIAKFRGQFDGGWDQMRKETLARQIRLGVAPPGTKLTAKPAGIQDWDALSTDEKRLFARQMEVFAGFAAHTDHEIGRLVDALQEQGQLDNTLLMYVVGDNGDGAEGGLQGTSNEMMSLNGLLGQAETVADQLKRIDELGGPMAFGQYAVGWALAGDTPFQWTKGVASHFGGTRNPLVIHWPNRIHAREEIRSQFHHVIDIAPTVLEAAGLPQPKSVNGTIQKPIEGVSMVYTFDDAKAPSRHTTQYFEMFGNRGVYHDGWTAVTKHRTPWKIGRTKVVPFDQDKWELYHVSDDFSQADDLAAKCPRKLKELQALWLSEAKKYNVLPLDDRSGERFLAAITGRPDLMGNRSSLTLTSGMEGIPEMAMIDVKNRSFSITADVEVPNHTANGVILCQGGRFAGWSLYLKDGRPSFVYNWVGAKRYTIAAGQPLPPGKATIRYAFAYDGGPLGSGGTGTLFVNSQKVAEGRIEKTVPYIFSLSETADVGTDSGTPVTEDYPQGDNRFTGTIQKVVVEVAPRQLSDDQQEKIRKVQIALMMAE